MLLHLVGNYFTCMILALGLAAGIMSLFGWLS